MALFVAGCNCGKKDSQVVGGLSQAEPVAEKKITMDEYAIAFITKSAFINKGKLRERKDKKVTYLISSEGRLYELSCYWNGNCYLDESS
jgi:hypothetical protein